MDATPSRITGDYLISVFDLENFSAVSRRLDSEGQFLLLNELQVLTITTLTPAKPRIVKSLGDSNLIIFDPVDIDGKISLLESLKCGIERLLGEKGHACRASFSSHFGEVTMGMFGTAPFAAPDAFGDAINVTFQLNGKPFRGRFTISPQLFRKLGPETRKRYHKYTPQIVYTAG